MGDMVVIRPDPFSRTSPRSIRRASRVRVALAWLQADDDRLLSGIDHRWAHGDGGNGDAKAGGDLLEDRRRQAPAVGAAHCTDAGAMSEMLLHKAARYLHGLHREGVDLDPIQDAALVAAGETPGQDPAIGHAAHVPAAILRPDQQGAACSVGKGNGRFQRPIRFNALSGAESSRFNASVLPSGRLSRSCRSIVLKFIIGTS